MSAEHDETFTSRTDVGVPADELWNWHARPGAFERLVPHWDDTVLETPPAPLTNGGRVVLRTRIGPFPARWVAENRDVVPGRSFRDVQVEGPFARFEHVHAIEAAGAGAALTDTLTYRLPAGAVGRAFGAGIARRRLERTFAHRRATMQDDLARHAAAAGRGAMKVLVTGASGLVGSSLVPFLTTGGHAVVRAVRRRAGAGEVAWDPAAGSIDAAALAGTHAIVHLAGESVGQRWNDAVKKRILASRVQGTRLVAETAARLDPKPSVLVCASAIGFYGDTGDRAVDETAPRGEGFLAHVVEEWERAAEPARAAGIRVVHLRFGVVLSPRGGALAKLLTPFKMGVGGVLGGGAQHFPWIGVDDAVGVVHAALTDERLRGPVNAVAPQDVTNRTLTKTLGRVLHRPTIFPMPAPVVRLVFGEMGEEMLLAGCRVVPRRLTETGYRWRHAQLEDALRAVLGKP